MSHLEEFDLIVVGGGPAGSATAIHLARAGHNVVLLDRHSFPRAKPCGDCLSAGATRLLRELGVLPRLELEDPARLEGWRIIAPSGRFLYRGFKGLVPADPTEELALALPRSRLDHLLLDAARRAGAEVRTGHRVVDLIRGPSGEVVGVRSMDPQGEPRVLHAHLVVGADGLRSTIARRLDLIRRLPRLRKISLTAHLTGIEGLGPRGELHIIPGACVGLAPVQGPRQPQQEIAHNLTLVVDGNRYAREIAQAGTGPFFRSILGSFPRLRERLPELGSDPESLPSCLLASGPFDWPTRTPVAPGAALVGDAAGYYDPFTGQGIYQGLAAARILAEEADLALRGATRRPLHLRRYARRRADSLRGAHLVQRLIEAVISRPALADFAISRLAAAPYAAGALIATTGDLWPARTLLSPRTAWDLIRPRARREPK